MKHESKKKWSGKSLLISLIILAIIGATIALIGTDTVPLEQLSEIGDSIKKASGIVTISALFVVFTTGIIFIRVFLLAPFLSKLADNERFITRRVENTWMPTESSGKFVRGVLTKEGYYLDGYYPSTIIKEGQKNSDLSWFERWLEKKGFVWLGIDSPSITRRGTLIIQATRPDPKARAEKKPLNEWIHSEPKTIRELRISFPHYILVTNMDLSDGNKASALVRIDVFVDQPYKLWYGLGRQAYATIDTIMASKIRTEFEKYTLEQLLYQGDDILQGKNNAQDMVEDELKKIVLDDKNPGTNSGNRSEFDFIGVKIRGVQIEEWTYEAPPGFLEALQRNSSKKPIEPKGSKSNVLAKKSRRRRSKP